MSTGCKAFIGCVICFIAVLIIGICIFLGVYFGLRGDDNDDGDVVISTSGSYQKAAVASDSILCSREGANIMASGGSAADGAIATIICLGVVNCHSTGIGGGGFMVLHKNDDPDNPVVIDFREVAPAAATFNMYDIDTTLSRRGGRAIAVPGMIKGLVHIYKKFGHNSWSTLIQPAINFAKDGFTIHEALATAIEKSSEYILDRQNFPGLNNLFTKSDHVTLLKEGDILKQPDLARTLQNIADRTPDQVVEYFYNSEFTDELVNVIDQYNGILQKEDFINYEVNEYPALTTEFFGLKVLGTRAPSSGVIFNFILSILKGYVPLNNTDLSYHYIVEAFKFAYAHHSLLGDPRNNPVVRDLEDFLLNDNTAARARSLIMDKTNEDLNYYILYNNNNNTEVPSCQTDDGTSHLSVLADNGDSIAVTTTINHFFGSKVVAGSSGIIFNDQMDDFTQPHRSNISGLPEGFNNFILPGNRPRSSANPTIMLNGSTNAVIIGASGGFKIITATLLSTINHLFFGLSIDEAIESPRIHHQWCPNVLEYESNFPRRILTELMTRNHEVMEVTDRLSFGAVQGITQAVSPDKLIFAHSDSRKGGSSAGY